MNLKTALQSAMSGDFIHARVDPQATALTYDSEAIIKENECEPDEDWIFVCDYGYLSGYIDGPDDEDGMDRLLDEINEVEFGPLKS